MNNEIDRIIKEAISEGILDKLKSSLGIGGDTNKYGFDDPGGGRMLLPKDTWIELMRNEPRRVNMLANTSIGDAGRLVLDLLKDISATSPEARKLNAELERAVRARDKETVVKIVRGLQMEADKIRTVRAGVQTKRESFSFKGLVLSDEISNKFEKGLSDKLSDI